MLPCTFLQKNNQIIADSVMFNEIRKCLYLELQNVILYSLHQLEHKEIYYIVLLNIFWLILTAF